MTLDHSRRGPRNPRFLRGLCGAGLGPRKAAAAGWPEVQRGRGGCFPGTVGTGLLVLSACPLQPTGQVSLASTLTQRESVAFSKAVSVGPAWQ